MTATTDETSMPSNQRAKRFAIWMNRLSWLLGVLGALAAWFLARRYGVSALGQDILLLTCFFAGALALYVVQFVKVIIVRLL